jgi:syntaxin 8
MQINDELEVHTGLLEEMDNGLDNTGIRLGRARQRLGRVANGAKEHSELPVVSPGMATDHDADCAVSQGPR